MAEGFAQVDFDVRLRGVTGARLGDLVPAVAVAKVAGDAEVRAVGDGATHLRRSAPDDTAAVRVVARRAAVRVELAFEAVAADAVVPRLHGVGHVVVGGAGEFDLFVGNDETISVMRREVSLSSTRGCTRTSICLGGRGACMNLDLRKNTWCIVAHTVTGALVATFLSPLGKRGVPDQEVCVRMVASIHVRIPQCHRLDGIRCLGSRGCRCRAETVALSAHLPSV